MFITSSGLAKTHHSTKLGTYSKDETSNGRISYKNLQGYYLHFSPSRREWLVSTKQNILIEIYYKTIYTCCMIPYTRRINYLNLQPYVNYNELVLIQVSDQKGKVKGYIESNCDSICPYHCNGAWKTYIFGSWEKDSTLAVINQGNKKSLYWIPPVVKIGVRVITIKVNIISLFNCSSRL